MSSFAFLSDETNSEINEEHRADIMHVLMKLLDGKLHVKDARSNRHAAIFRFIAGCQPKEVEIFLKTIFWLLDSSICECRRCQGENPKKYLLFQPDKASAKRARALIANYNPRQTITLRRLRR